MTPPLTCILCKHMQMRNSTPDYSEYTPGTDWSANCESGHWWMDGDDVTVEQFRHNLLMAETCDEFENVKSD